MPTDRWTFPKKPKIYSFAVPTSREELFAKADGPDLSAVPRQGIEPEAVPIIDYWASRRYTKQLAEEYGCCWCSWREARPEEIPALRRAYDPEWREATDGH